MPKTKPTTSPIVTVTNVRVVRVATLRDRIEASQMPVFRTTEQPPNPNVL